MDMTDTSRRLLTEERLSEAIKIGSVLASIAAIIYLYGFSLSARVNILAYVSFTDYLRVAIGWILPSFGLPLLAGYCIPQFPKAVRQSKDTEPGSDCFICEYERKMNIYFKLILGLLDLSVLNLVAAVLLGVDLKMIFQFATTVAGIVCFTAFAWFTKSAEGNAIRLGHEKLSLMFLVAILVILSLGYGLAHGTVAGKTSSIVRDFVVVTAENDSQICGELLFSFDKFVVIRESGHTELTFLPSDKVTLIRTPVSIPPSTPGPQSYKK